MLVRELIRIKYLITEAFEQWSDRLQIVTVDIERPKCDMIVPDDVSTCLQQRLNLLRLWCDLGVLFPEEFKKLSAIHGVSRRLMA